MISTKLGMNFMPLEGIAALRLAYYFI